MAFKMKGSPMARNYGAPFTHKLTNPETGKEWEHPEHEPIEKRTKESIAKDKKIREDAIDTNIKADIALADDGKPGDRNPDATFYD